VTLVGGIMAHNASTSNGTVEVHSVEWINENGASMHAVLYVPENVSAANPVPGIVANHGFTSNSEAMHLHAIEMSRRGYVVIAPDAYAHGNTSYPDMTIEGGVINDMGHYSCIQYLGRLPYVDSDNIGLIGHSMGSDCARFGALRAFQEKEAGNDNVIVPKSILLTSNSFKAVAADSTGSVLGAEQSGQKVDPINAYPVNYGTIFGQFDEFAGMMWGVGKGSEFKNSAQFAVGMGFEGADYGNYHAYGNSTVLTREQAIEAGNARTLRVGFNPALTHAFTLFDEEPVALALEFFDITLSNGKLASSTYAYDDQIWTLKPIGGTGVEERLHVRIRHRMGQRLGDLGAREGGRGILRHTLLRDEPLVEASDG
jgi:pimeloyl-ACP methyl ester carboxylesterase